ncbi:MAG: sigma-54 dependent transcriptional regulator [Thermodesulfobacteriota bacterium]
MDERLLIVEDEETLRESLKRVFQREGYQVEAVGSAEPALELFEEGFYDLIITDIILPGITGIELLKRVKEIHPEQIVIIITAYASLETAVETLRAGAYDYIVKPIIHEEIKQIVKNALRQRALQKENVLLKKQMGGSYDLSRIVGENPEILKIISRIKKIAEARSPVLFIGELGTGKKLIARAIHFSSYRADRPFLPINCQAIPEERIESELFGRVKGTPGENLQATKGLFEEANGGTIYLDKVDELPDSMQFNLLRVLEDQEFKPLGAPQGVKADLLIIASAYRDLEPLVQEGRFRQDLYRRLRVISVSLPPLRERKEDIESLARFFIQRYAREFGKKTTGLEQEALNLFDRYDWPGNVRELRNLMERAVLLAEEEIIKANQFPQLHPAGH